MSILALGLLALATLPLTGCGKDKGDDSGATGSNDLVFADANNYSYQATLSVDSVAIQPGADVHVDWSQLTHDLRGRELDPSAVDHVSLIAFSITKDEVLASINNNSLKQSDIRDYRLYDNSVLQASSADLTDFSILGNAFDPTQDLVEREGTWTWAVSLWSREDSRDEILFTLFLTLDPSSDNHDLVFTDDSGSLSFLVDLHSAAALQTVAGASTYSYDWAGATQEASGQDFDTAKGDRLLIGYVAGQDVSYVEDNIMSVLDTADGLYHADTYGLTHVDLAQAVDSRSGAPFGGFTTDGVWLIGIECMTCTSPAPLLLSVVDVAAAN